MTGEPYSPANNEANARRVAPAEIDSRHQADEGVRHRQAGEREQPARAQRGRQRLSSAHGSQRTTRAERAQVRLRSADGHHACLPSEQGRHGQQGEVEAHGLFGRILRDVDLFREVGHLEQLFDGLRVGKRRWILACDVFDEGGAAQVVVDDHFQDGLVRAVDRIGRRPAAHMHARLAVVTHHQVADHALVCPAGGRRTAGGRVAHKFDGLVFAGDAHDVEHLVVAWLGQRIDHLGESRCLFVTRIGHHGRAHRLELPRVVQVREHEHE